MKKLSVIIINYNTAAMTERVIKQFRAMEIGLDHEMIVIDNGDRDRISQAQACELGVKLILNEKNIGFAAAVNQGIGLSKGEFVLLLNSDILIGEKAISRLLHYMELEKNTGICGPQFLYPAGNFQSSFGRFPTAWREWLRFSYLYNIIPGATIAKHTWLKKIDLERPQSVDWLSGGCFLIRRNVIEEVGLFDENYFLGVEDMDYCYRAKKLGWAVVYHPLTQAVHYHGLSSGGVRNILRFTHDRDGLGYFFRKNRPQDRFSPNFVSALYNLKIMMLKLQTAVKNFRSDSHRPQDATMAVTYRCNSRCRMCNIWQEKGSAELPLKAFTHLSPNIKYVNLTGGEPFLRDDLPLIVRAVKKASPQAQIIISSNGLATERIVNAMADIIDIDKNVGVRVSLDGTGAAHDRIRGIPGIYERALTTIEKLRVLGVENLGISFTIMDTNIDELRTVYKLAKDLGLQLALALVQNSDIYFKKGDNRLTALAKIKLALDYVIASELKSFNPKKWLRAYYDYGLYYYAWHGKRLLPSGAGFDSLFVDPSGTVYPSNLINLPMGNLTDDSIDKLWSGSIAVKTREKIISENIQESWIICTIRGEMKKHLAQVLIWIVKNKTRVHLKDLKGYLSGFWFKQYAGGVYPSK